MFLDPHADNHEGKRGEGALLPTHTRLGRYTLVRMEMFHNMGHFYFEKGCAKGELPLGSRGIGFRYSFWPNPGHCHS